MKKILLTSLFALAGSITASATTVSFVCNPFPATFNNGAGGSSINCPSLDSGGATGATVLNGVTLTYYATYQFGNVGTNSINVAFTPDTQAGALTWNLPSTTVNNTNGQSTVINTATGSLTSGVALSTFLNAGFNVGVASSVASGGVATSSGAVQVTYDYTVASSSVPEPATISMIGVSLLGLGFASRKRKV